MNARCLQQMIGIAGPSGSGKSELAARLATEYATCAPVVITIDHYYRDQRTLTPTEREVVNYDHPHAIDLPQLLHDLTCLKEGHPIEMPRYDYATHLRASQGVLVTPTPLLIVEGILALYWPELRALYDVAIYVDTPDAVCLQRRIARDTRERGRTRESVVAQYATTVQPMAAAYVWPTRQYADVVLAGDETMERLMSRVHAHISTRPAPDAKEDRPDAKG